MAEELRFRARPDHEKHERGLSGKMALDEALRAREQFLSEQPQLRAYQAEMDGTLQNVIGFENRMAVLGMMMQVKIYQLKDVFTFPLFKILTDSNPDSKAAKEKKEEGDAWSDKVRPNAQ